MHSPILAHRALVIASLENNDDHTPAPKPATDAIPVSELNVRLLTGETINHNPLKGHSGTSSQFLTNTHAEISFEIALPFRKNTATKTVPWSNLLQACGMNIEPNDEANSKNLSLSLIPAENLSKALSFHYYLDGQLYSIRNARGNAIFILDPGQLPILRFAFIGKTASVADTPLPQASFAAWNQPIPVSPQNTSISVHNTQIAIQRLSLNLGNNLRMLHRTNLSASLINNREPSGSLSFDHTDRTTFDPLSLIKNETLIPLSITHGDTSAQYWKVSCPHIQLLEPSLQKDGNVSSFSIPFSVHKISLQSHDIKVFAS
jgi:hypothetical protein